MKNEEYKTKIPSTTVDRISVLAEMERFELSRRFEPTYRISSLTGKVRITVQFWRVPVVSS